MGSPDRKSLMPRRPAPLLAPLGSFLIISLLVVCCVFCCCVCTCAAPILARRDLAGLVAREALVRVLLRDGGEQEDGALHADAVVVVRPVRRRGDGLLVGELQGLHAAQDLVHVAADAGRVVHHQHQLVLRVDDEDGADGERQALCVRVPGVDHAVELGDGPVLVADDRELHLGPHRETLLDLSNGCIQVNLDALYVNTY